MLFSGLGDIEKAQETLSVGVGALAGSTIMLLTVPWALSVFAGRVDIQGDKLAYGLKTKVTPGKSICETMKYTGVSISDPVQKGGSIMMITTIPYFLIQIPAWYIKPGESVAAGEKNWALLALVVCLIGFVWYLVKQLEGSRQGEDQAKRVEMMKDLIKAGEISLSGAMNDVLKTFDNSDIRASSYQSADETPQPPQKVKEYLSLIVRDLFRKYDKNQDNTLSKMEITFFLRDMHEDISEDEVDTLFAIYDKDNGGTICFDEFVCICYSIVKTQRDPIPADISSEVDIMHKGMTANIMEEDEETEDMPEDVASLPAEKQQAALKKKAFTLLAIGTALVLLFADPMVEVLQEVAVRVNIPPFYVSFILAPLASNASEMIASQYYAAKKTKKSITVSLMALEGAASMNNTFCLSIFMALIYFRGLAWKYTAETVTIVLVIYFVGFMTRGKVMTTMKALIILCVFPLSIVLIAGMEAVGFD
eukprot:CAMPEP_0197831748 /NCGR_PEP_ID=MMETSP1437-20131217/11889_1 /TAXON_ID=49252 ORGANISM="Eucampia antarctica, Strain CCMP1452" /NCGR_SAMPLE_ID=MMETSP1437 /ASSEMBLY_ACC=CAM_ASM_001096 /LENGTH=477 /DNA_ID=CAMNT_0043434799 /DNA_START=351 /DNA_END=1784 /DNA_ORIENTATION=+